MKLNRHFLGSLQGLGKPHIGKVSNRRQGAIDELRAPATEHRLKTARGILRSHKGPHMDKMGLAISTGWWLGHPSEKYESQLG